MTASARLKMALLEKAFAGFSSNAATAAPAKFEAFCEGRSAWLADYAFFRALMEENGGTGKRGTSGRRNIAAPRRRGNG